MIIQSNFFQYKNHVPRRAQYLHKAWKRHQDAVYWVDINLALKKGLKFYQTRSNAIILHEILPAYCIPKAVMMETGEVIYEKVYMSPRPPPKISLKHEWKRELGSEHAQQPEVGQLSRSFQSNQPISNPSRERTVRPVVKDDTRTVRDGRKTSRSQEIDVNSFHEEHVSSERTGHPLLKRVESKHVHLKTKRIPTSKRYMKERGDSLLKQRQKMCQIVVKHVLVMKAKHSTLEIKHFVKER